MSITVDIFSTISVWIFVNVNFRSPAISRCQRQNNQKQIATGLAEGIAGLRSWRRLT